MQILLITPPFTQLNTPYPATAYLKGFCNTIGIESVQCDLGIEVILALFSKQGLANLFERIEEQFEISELSPNGQRISVLKDEYLATIDSVIHFLQNNDQSLAYSIAERDYLPEASRFDQIEELDWAFGTMGIRDKARHFATLYLEDLSDLIQETVDPNFGFSRYAERLGMSANSFDQLNEHLLEHHTFIEEILIDITNQRIKDTNPDLICLSVPFPGNLVGALRIGQFVKTNFPKIKVALGGGYANTELRSLNDQRVFHYLDYVLLDDGERPLQCLLEHLGGKRPIEKLKRTFALLDETVVYFDNSNELDIAQRDVGTPDYSDLLLDKYLSVIEVTNPMHRLWSDGRWNKLTLAHGCYWGKCSFCDVTLDYIERYEPVTAEILCDRIETIIKQTGETGFHFVDEAAPPALMRDLALEILKRNLKISWWTNIRFEKSFSYDLCQLLRKSGCIAVSGGLEVASDRLLKLMKKGVTVEQVTRVANNFTESGIMVHAYLMYGFPTQSAQETIDALEVVRQLFMNGVLQSGFWHQFAMTAHSPVGKNPELYNVVNLQPAIGDFANNDLPHEDVQGADHQSFSEGLKTSLFNYMHGVCFEFDLQEWFDFEIPETILAPDYILNILEFTQDKVKDNPTLIWIGPSEPLIDTYTYMKKGKEVTKCSLIFHSLNDTYKINCSMPEVDWLLDMLSKHATLNEWSSAYSDQDLGDFNNFLQSTTWEQLKNNGLLHL